MPREALLLLGAALAASLLINLSGQFVGTNLADIQGGIGASADEASWLSTAYTMAQFGGLIMASPVLATFGLRRSMTAGALLFAATALACAAAPPLPLMIGLRALQGFAAGAFGPLAFVATFTTSRGARLPFALAVLALVLLLPASFGPVASAIVEDSLGWEGLFLVQAMIGVAIASAALLVMPRSPISWSALHRDWIGLLLLGTASAATMLVLGQGTRLYWLDSSIVTWSIIVAIAAWSGFTVSLLRSPLPVMDLALLAKRGFVVTITLNLVFRVGFAGLAFLVPQFLAMVQGYRPIELAELFLWAGIPQVLMFPVTWWLLQRIDGRLIAASGLVLFGLGLILASGSTSADAADQFRLVLALGGAGQVLVLVPNLVAGGSSLTAAEGPTASLMFNGTTVGGVNLGVALAAELVTERQKFHFGAIVESATAFGPKLDQIEALAARFTASGGDEVLPGTRAILTLAASVRREAWVLSFDDAFLLLGGMLVGAAVGPFLLNRQPAPGSSSTQERRPL
jgi:DHA2 family multidrug resistance protein